MITSEATRQYKEYSYNIASALANRFALRNLLIAALGRRVGNPDLLNPFSKDHLACCVTWPSLLIAFDAKVDVLKPSSSCPPDSMTPLDMCVGGFVFTPIVDDAERVVDSNRVLKTPRLTSGIIVGLPCAHLGGRRNKRNVQYDVTSLVTSYPSAKPITLGRRWKHIFTCFDCTYLIRWNKFSTDAWERLGGWLWYVEEEAVMYCATRWKMLDQWYFSHLNSVVYL